MRFQSECNGGAEERDLQECTKRGRQGKQEEGYVGWWRIIYSSGYMQVYMATTSSL